MYLIGKQHDYICALRGERREVLPEDDVDII